MFESRLKHPKDELIHDAWELNNGQIGVIVKSAMPEYMNRIVFRQDNQLVDLTKPTGGWIINEDNSCPTLKIKLLESGTVIELVVGKND